MTRKTAFTISLVGLTLATGLNSYADTGTNRGEEWRVDPRTGISVYRTLPEMPYALTEGLEPGVSASAHRCIDVRRFDGSSKTMTVASRCPAR